jgi:uncharacterized protein YdiU (UPF0061 family)
MSIQDWLDEREQSSKAATALPMDHSGNRSRRTTIGFCGCELPVPVLNVVGRPRVLIANRRVFHELGLRHPDEDKLVLEYLDLVRPSKRGRAEGGDGASQHVAPSSVPFAWCYAGFQFGVMAGQLGDGRSATVLEIGRGSRDKPYREVQLKGGVTTPYSRGLDGLLTARGAVKEYLLLEYLNALGLPAASGVAVALGSTKARRDTTLQNSAVLCRTMRSGLRIGTLEAQFYTGKHDVLRQLMQHFVDVHAPVLKLLPQTVAVGGRWHGMLRTIAESIGRMVAGWVAYGFVHGVMNTDNMSLHGETMDIGPAAFLTRPWDDTFTLNEDDDHGMYAFGKQQTAGRKNVEKLALALSPLFSDGTDLADTVAAAKLALADGIAAYDSAFDAELIRLVAERLGFARADAVTQQSIATMTLQCLRKAGDAVKDGTMSAEFAQGWSINGFFCHWQGQQTVPRGWDCTEVVELRAALRTLRDDADFFPARNPVFTPSNEQIQAVAAFVADLEIDAREASLRFNRVAPYFAASSIFAEDNDRDAFFEDLVQRTSTELLQECGCG